MEFYRKNSGLRINVDELEEVLNKDLIDVVAEIIVSMDEFDVECEGAILNEEISELFRQNFFEEGDRGPHS